MDMTTLIGATGAAILLLAFILNEVHVWSEDDLSYDFANFAGAALLLWYAWILGSWPFGILNGVWALVSLRDIFRDMKKPPRLARRP